MKTKRVQKVDTFSTKQKGKMSAVFHISKQKNFVNYVHVNICIKLCYNLIENKF